MIHQPLPSGSPSQAAPHSPQRHSSTAQAQGQGQQEQGQGQGPEEGNEAPPESDPEYASSSAMMKEWMDFHKLAHMLMESVQCTVRRAGDPPSSDMQQDWATKSYSMIAVVAKWAAQPSTSSLTVKKQHSVVVGTAGASPVPVNRIWFACQPGFPVFRDDRGSSGSVPPFVARSAWGLRVRSLPRCRVPGRHWKLLKCGQLPETRSRSEQVEFLVAADASTFRVVGPRTLAACLVPRSAFRA